MKIEALGLFDGASFFRTVITNQTVLVCSHFLKLNKVTIMEKKMVSVDLPVVSTRTSYSGSSTIPWWFPSRWSYNTSKSHHVSCETGWKGKFFIPDGHGRLGEVKMIKLTCPQGSIFFLFNHHITFSLFVFHSIEPISNEKVIITFMLHKLCIQVVR